MLLPGTTALIGYHTGCFTQAIFCAGNSHNSQRLLEHFLGKNLYQLLLTVQAISFCVVFALVYPNHFKGSFSNSTKHITATKSLMTAAVIYMHIRDV